MANERVWSLATIEAFWNKIKNLVSGYKTKQTAVNDPSASGTGVTFIDSISQNANGVITPTKKTVRTMGAASSSAAGSTGLVPAPAAGKQSKFLRGDGTWNTPTDTKNTAGSTDSSSKLFLIGATSQGANPQTYSQDTAYVGTDGCLYSGSKKVLTDHQDISGKKNTQTAVSDPSASGTGITFIDSISQNTQGVISPTKKTVRSASQSADGLMSSTDKTKLDGIATGATANVGTITGITMNGASKGTSGVVNLGTVLTSHQDISSKANRDEIGIVVTGNTASQNVTSGQYVTVRNSTISGISDGLYKASANVSAGTAFTSSNLTAVPNGGLNSLNEQIWKLQCGRIAYTHSASQTSVGVSFPKAFSSTPTVVITVYNIAGVPVQSWLYSVSREGFHVNCFYPNWQSTFDGEVHWMAFE